MILASRMLVCLAMTGLLLTGACSRPYIVRTPAADTGITMEGLGVELDPHFLSQNVTRSDGATVQDWTDIVVRRVQEMRVERFRVMLLPHWWEPEPGVFTFDSAEMQSVRAVLDLAQQTGAGVTLVLWGCPAGCLYVEEGRPSQGQRHFLCDPAGTNWVTAPEDDEAFAACFSAVVRRLLEEGYTCIREVTPFNEPDGDVCAPDQYRRIVRAMDRRFRADGIRDKVLFNLSDNTDCRRYFLRATADSLAACADLFNSHTYIFGYDTPNRTVLKWERKNLAAVAHTGRKHFVGEFGSNLCKGASRQTDINWYKRGVLIVRNCLNFLNAGAAGASYWSLLDQYYNRSDPYEIMQQLGLWRYKKQVYRGEDAEGCTADYQVRPQYHAWSLLTRFIRKGDAVHPLDLKNRFAAGSAIRSEDGRWTYVFANGSEKDLTFDLRNPSAEERGPLSLYRYAEGMLPEGDEPIAPSAAVTPRNGRIRVSLPAQTVLLLTEKE